MTDDNRAAGPGDLGPFAEPDAGAIDAPGAAVDVPGGQPGDGEVLAIEIPSRYKPELWRRALTVFQLHWDREGKVPTAAEAHADWDRIPLKTYQELTLELEFQRALELRGIDLDPTDSLSDIQVSVLLKLTDPSDRRTERAKLRDLGVSWPRYQGWLRNPVFVKEKRRRVEATFADVSDVALVKLRGNVEAGDQRAIEYALEVTGRYNRNTLAVQEARVVVQTLVEAIIKNVPDAATREAILRDGKAAAAAFDLNNRKAIGQ